MPSAARGYSLVPQYHSPGAHLHAQGRRRDDRAPLRRESGEGEPSYRAERCRRRGAGCARRGARGVGAGLRARRAPGYARTGAVRADGRGGDRPRQPQEARPRAEPGHRADDPAARGVDRPPERAVLDAHRVRRPGSKPSLCGPRRRSHRRSAGGTGPGVHAAAPRGCQWGRGGGRRAIARRPLPEPIVGLALDDGTLAGGRGPPRGPGTAAPASGGVMPSVASRSLTCRDVRLGGEPGRVEEVR